MAARPGALSARAKCTAVQQLVLHQDALHWPWPRQGCELAANHAKHSAVVLLIQMHRGCLVCSLSVVDRVHATAGASGVRGSATGAGFVLKTRRRDARAVYFLLPSQRGGKYPCNRAYGTIFYKIPHSQVVKRSLRYGSDCLLCTAPDAARCVLGGIRQSRLEVKARG